MTDKTTVRLDDVTVRGPFTNTGTNKKTGQEFTSTTYTLVLTAGGVEYTESFRKDDTKPVKAGDTVTITFQRIEGKKGTYNSIVKDGVQITTEASLPANDTPLVPKSTTNTTHGTSQKTTGLTGSANQGARLGMIINNAVEMAMHNARVTNTTVSLDEVNRLATKLTQLVSDHEGT
jgi:hypothetical protein